MSKSNELSDGLVSIKVPVNGELVEHSIDLIELNCIVTEVEANNPLPVTATGHSLPTMQFLRAMVAALDAVGIKGVSPTGAWQIWLTVSAELERLKKSIYEMPS